MEREGIISKAFRFHTGWMIGISCFLSFGFQALCTYCRSVHIGYSAFICKIIEELIFIILFYLLCWGIFSYWIPRDKKKQRILRKKYPRFHLYVRIPFVLLITGIAAYVSIRTAYPVIADMIAGPETAVVSYINTNHKQYRAGRFSGNYTLYHLRFQDINEREITIDLSSREYNTYRKYFEHLNRQELTFYRHTHIAILEK